MNSLKKRRAILAVMIGSFLLLNFTAIVPRTFHFKAGNIYYNILSDDAVEVTFRDTTYNSYKNKIIRIPQTISHEGKTYSVVQIGDFAFTNSNTIKSISLPNSITKIGKSAFQNCSNLKDIGLPNSIKIIDKYAFALCKNIQSVTIPKDVKVIKEATFLACENLENIELSENIKIIEAIAFINCKNLKTVTFHEYVKDLKGCAIFNNCKNLESIKLMSNTPPEINPMMINDIDFEQCQLMVSKGSKQSYENAKT